MTLFRLGALREVMKEWDGPVAVAVYIEYKADTEQAGSCESKVTQYMKEAVAELWPSVDAAPPVSVSFLYTAFDIPDAACVVKQSGKSPEDSQSHDDAGHAAGESSPHTSYHAGSREYGSPSIPQRLYNRMQRNLLEAWQQGGSSQSPPDSMPQVGHNPTPVKSVWHFKRGGTKVMVSSRPWKQVYDEFYPVNALRNLAWEQVRAHCVENMQSTVVLRLVAYALSWFHIVAVPGLAAIPCWVCLENTCVLRVFDSS